MKDKWINIGYEGDELTAHIEPVEDFNDTSRIGKSASALTLRMNSLVTLEVVEPFYYILMFLFQMSWLGWASLGKRSEIH